MARYIVEQIRRAPQHRVIRRETVGLTTIHTEVARYDDPDDATVIAAALNAFAPREVSR